MISLATRFPKVRSKYFAQPLSGNTSSRGVRSWKNALNFSLIHISNPISTKNFAGVFHKVRASRNSLPTFQKPIRFQLALFWVTHLRKVFSGTQLWRNYLRKRMFNQIIKQDTFCEHLNKQMWNCRKMNSTDFLEVTWHFFDYS